MSHLKQIVEEQGKKIASPNFRLHVERYDAKEKFNKESLEQNMHLDESSWVVPEKIKIKLEK